MSNWRVTVQTDSGQIKQVLVCDYNFPGDASQAALAQTGAKIVISCVPDWSDSEAASTHELQSDSGANASRAFSVLADEISSLSSGVAGLRLQIKEDKWKRKANDGFRDMWTIENERAEEEGRPSLSYSEMKLIWGDPDDLDSFALYERQREGGRVPVECPLCSSKLRIPDGRRGTICCPTCQDDFYVDATHAYQSRPDKGARSSDCFIATAAFGSKDAKSVIILRQWRSQYLLRSRAGICACKLYAVISPSIAKWIAGSPRRCRLVQICLKPIVVAASLMVDQ